MQKFLLPKNLGALSKLCSTEVARYALGAVNILCTQDNTYHVQATNGRYAGIVTGPCADATEYPSIPALDSAPNGELGALIPGKDFEQACKAVPAGRKIFRPILRNLACVFSKNQSTLASTDISSANVSSPLNVDGRFPSIGDAIPTSPPDAVVSIDANLMIRLLQVASQFADGDNCRVTLEIRKDKPIVLHCGNSDGQSFVGILMPLSK